VTYWSSLQTGRYCSCLLTPACRAFPLGQAVRTPAGRRRCRPEKVHADKAYDHRRCRGYLARRGIKVRIARCGIESSRRLGRHRWKAERSIAWLAGCRRLRVRYDRDSERFFAFAMLACDRLCYNRLPCAATARLP